MRLHGRALQRRLVARYGLIVRDSDSTDPPPPRCFRYSDDSRWFSGHVEGLPLGLQWRSGLRRFGGTIVVGPDDCNARLEYRRPRRRAPLELVPSWDRFATCAALPGVAEALKLLSPAVREVRLAPRGVRSAEYGLAGFEQLTADIAALARIARAILEEPDPPLLAAVKAGDLEGVRARLDAGDDPARPGPRDCEPLPGWGPRPQTPLLEAVARGEAAALRLILDRSSLSDGDSGPAFALCAERRRADVLDELLQGGEVLPGSWMLNGALSEAVRRNWADGVRRLLAHGADPTPVELPQGPESAEVRELLTRARIAARGEDRPIGQAELYERGIGPVLGRSLGRLLSWLPGGRRRAARAWREAAARLGLTPLDGPAGLALGGQVDGLEVRVEAAPSAGGDLTVISVSGPPEWLALRRETLREKLGLTAERFIEPSAATQWAKVNDVLTKDNPFDERIDVRGPIEDCLALLCRDLRWQVLGLVDRLGGTVERGRVRLERPGVLADPEHLRRLVLAAHELARALAHRAAGGTLAGLLENATTDPSELVRIAMLGALGSRFPGAPETIEASRLAVSAGRCDWYRMTGASNLGEEGTAAFRSILAEAQHEPSVRGMALRHLGWRGERAAEELVLSYLDDPHREIVLHAVRILGERCGTHRAVAPLRERAGTLALGEVARAAATAVERIQSRLANAAPGQLSLAETPQQQGELSLATAAGGALSPAPGKEDGPA